MTPMRTMRQFPIAGRNWPRAFPGPGGEPGRGPRAERARHVGVDRGQAGIDIRAAYILLIISGNIFNLPWTLGSRSRGAARLLHRRRAESRHDRSPRGPGPAP